MTLGEKLGQLRKQAGLSQEDLGGIIGVSRQAVQKWEAGSASPEITNLAALCDHFGVTMDYLVRDKEAYEAEPQAPASYHYKHRYRDYEYKSEKQIFGLPLVHINYGYGFRRAKGIIAIGNVATGVVAIGGLSLGVFSFGGLAAGILTLGGLALGLMAALGGIAVSLIFSIGGMAVSLGTALGGLAVGQQVALGGMAVSSGLAVGDQAVGGLSLTLRQLAEMGADESEALVRATCPDVENWVVRVIRHMAEAR